uniref:Uncharacterized protein n=1 Tax=Oryza rufipogon TaxID=4529 RepID=A0A0E0RFK0_ORYRU
MALFGVREYRQFERMTPERRAEYLVGMAGVLTLVTSIVLLLSGSTYGACLRDGDVCSGMTRLVRDPDTGIFVPELSPYERWLKEHGIKKGVHVMSPIESGCCKPPSSCGFTYVNGTTWIPTPAAAGAPAAATNVDCSRWSNNQQTLCFQCDSCKAGFLDDIKKAWSLDALYPILALIGAFLSCFAGVKYWRPRLDTGYSLIRERAVA